MPIATPEDGLGLKGFGQLALYNLGPLGQFFTEGISGRGLQGAAIRQANPEYNLARAAYEQLAFRDDESFDLEKWLDTNRLTRNANQFADVTSQKEAEYLFNKLKQEKRDIAIIENAGMLGLGAEAIAAMTSLTSVFPAGRVSQLANSLVVLPQK